ncbi:MAG: carbamate kinase [Thermoleophilia bacterium]|nr:carbamate kinase [Thermoleophilia bacterium]
MDAHGPTVVALGGNSLVRDGERGSEHEQRANVRRTVHALRSLVAGKPLVVTHGNGPQVGNELVRHERAAGEVPPLPVWLAVAQTQAEIGALIAAELPRVVARPVAVVLTHVRVDEDDPAFREPAKPIGPFYEEVDARRLERERRWRLVRNSDRGWRRVVASPLPRELVEVAAIRTLVDAGTAVVACGGGGIPVARRAAALVGVDAVVDKDHSSALLAAALAARHLVILTDVSAVQRGYGTPEAEDVAALTASEASALARELEAGSMRPKLEASAAFARATGGEALITSAGALDAALAGRAGTRVRP